MTKQELDEILKLHVQWLTNPSTGKRADLSLANLREADLRWADLRRADLRRADLRWADLSGADLPNFSIVPEIGVFYGFKKANIGEKDEVIITLEIPEKAKRMSSLIGRKCRAEYAKVINITSLDGKTKYKKAVSKHDKGFIYKVGQTIKPDKYNDDIRVECTNGIHFFITKKEAKEY